MSEERSSTPVIVPHGIEVELVTETRTAPFQDTTWRMVEVWTQNSIYAIDAAMRCFDVIDRGSLRPVSDHALLGSRLVGGQLQTPKGVELSNPFPLPGMEAVFEQIMRGGAASFSYSSAVTRVVLRLRRINMEGATTALWGDISSSPSLRPPPQGPGATLPLPAPALPSQAAPPASSQASPPASSQASPQAAPHAAPPAAVPAPPPSVPSIPALTADPEEFEKS